MGNGNEASGDGYRYRGRGIFQLTGKSNYIAFSSFYNANYDSGVDLVSNPGLLETDNKIAILSALWFYEQHVLNKLTIDSETTVQQVTEEINGGNNGIEDRKRKFNNVQENIDCYEN